MNSKMYPLVLLFILLVSACVPQSVPESPAPIMTEEPLPAAVETPVLEEPASTSNAWKAVRDARYGFGLAVPCWWLVSPIPAEGFGGVMTTKNYDEAYFNANSNKGFWDWPYGTLKLDLIVIEGVDPAKSDADAYMQFVDPTMTGLVSAESQQIGAHSVTVLILANLVNTNDPNTRIFVYRPAADRLLMVAPIPQSIIDTPDFQALLASIALTPDEQVTLPVITPAPALIDASCAQ